VCARKSYVNAGLSPDKRVERSRSILSPRGLTGMSVAGQLWASGARPVAIALPCRWSRNQWGGPVLWLVVRHLVCWLMSVEDLRNVCLSSAPRPADFFGHGTANTRMYLNCNSTKRRFDLIWFSAVLCARVCLCACQCVSYICSSARFLLNSSHSNLCKIFTAIREKSNKKQPIFK